ncbi:MAG: hypothetical protein HMLIMOIP_001484 [Candidatus Nitrosomirales archaeon]|jgi:hypothetical protein
MKYVFAIAIIFMLLFSASIPVYASHVKRTQPTADEKRLFDKIFERLEKHDKLLETKINDVKESLSEPMQIFFSCRGISGKSVESVTIDISTQFVSFDENVASQHEEGMLGGMYVWDCKAVKNSYTLTIECKNLLMLNPSFMAREETETNEKKVISMAENEVMAYHEFLHGQLLINAMRDNGDPLGWRKDACRFFAGNGNVIDYSPSDAEHKIIGGLELKMLSTLIEQNDGILVVKTIGKEAGTRNFTEVIAKFEELGDLADRGFFVFARTINLDDAEVLVSTEMKTVSVSAVLHDPEKDGVVRMFIMPKASVSNARIELEVDDAVKSIGSEFVFTARVHNMQKTDIVGNVMLIIDGLKIGGKDLSVPGNQALTVAFTWRSSDKEPSMHSAKVDGFSKVSNEVSIITFDRLVSATVQSDVVIAAQSVTDARTGEEVVVARPERISAIIADDVEYGVSLFAPDGTLIIGEEGLVHLGENEKLIEVGGQTLAIIYIDLNEKLRFVSVKSVQGLPLSEGEWVMKSVDMSGQDGDAKIKYYASYNETGQVNLA